MGDLIWLTNEARELHGIFLHLFYGLMTTFLLLGVFVEYFKWPLGQVPAFSVLVGRAVVAAILLHSYSEFTNNLADVTDAVAGRVGEFHKIDLVITRLGEELDTMSASWVSVKQTVSMAICYLSFFTLYFSKYVAEGIFMFTWILCYVFSPVLIAFFILPSTAGATRGLFRTLFEVSCWKIVWSVLATLLWSSALGSLNDPGAELSFVSVICLNLCLAGSLLLTPWVVHSLSSSGLAGFTKTLGGIAVGASFVTPTTVYRAGRSMAGKSLERSRGTIKATRDLVVSNRMGFQKPRTTTAARSSGDDASL